MCVFTVGVSIKFVTIIVNGSVFSLILYIFLYKNIENYILNYNYFKILFLISFICSDYKVNII